MTEVHIWLGFVILILTVGLFLWNAFRLAGASQGPSFRMILVGLLDLQVLIGIIAFVIHPVWGLWLLHPLLMLVAVAMGHVMLKESRPVRTQIWGYVLLPVFIIAGIYLPSL